MTIFYVYSLEKTGRPNQTQVAPGTAFQDVSLHGRSHIRNVSGPPSDFALLAPVRRTGSPSLSLSFEKCIHMKHLFSFQDVIGCSGQFMSKQKDAGSDLIIDFMKRPENDQRQIIQRTTVSRR
jgi:hypothetical protein